MKYRNIPFLKFAFGLIIVSIPVLVLNELGYQSWVWAYVILILTMFLVYQYGGIAKFASFVQNIK